MTQSIDSPAADPAGRTVGSLLGVPLGQTGALPPGPPVDVPRPAETGTPEALPASEAEGPGWTVRGGEPRTGLPLAGFRPNGVEALDFNNPFGQTMERVWFHRKLVFAIDCGELDVDPDRVAVAQEYQIVYDVALDEQGKLEQAPETVPGQYNIYDSVPGMEKYSPIWQFNYVVVPRDYRANALRSEADCLDSGYPIRRSRVFEN
jgi:hypothetical protein